MFLKAINTEYNDYLFRSRLEARWAVFFDSMSWEYEYEHEGFELSSGKKYLPDFKLHITYGKNERLSTFVEIKPTDELSENERNKIHSFVKDQGSILLLTGIPTTTKTYGTSISYNQKDDSFNYCECCFDNKKFGIYYGEWLHCEDPEWFEEITTAIRNSRRARFEFGQTPTPKELRDSMEGVTK